MTAIHDAKIRRGTTEPALSFLLKSGGQPFNGAGSTFVLVIYVRGVGEVIRKSTAENDGLTWDQAAGRLRWNRTVAESLRIPEGRIARYEVERHIAGSERAIVAGYIIGEASFGDG